MKGHPKIFKVRPFLEAEEGVPQYESSESVLGAMIFIEREVSAPCALVLCFPFFGHILRKADPKFFGGAESFPKLICLFLPPAL